MAYPYTLAPEDTHRLGLIVLQSDETIEADFRRLMPAEVTLFVSRVPSGTDVTPESLQAMANNMTGAAALFPRGMVLSSVGYGCTSGTAQIGAGRVHDLIRQGVEADAVTDPVSALIDSCQSRGIARLAFLSPYIEAVSARLRDTLAASGIETPVFGSFDEANEARVVRITWASIIAAAERLVDGADVDALFLSCTNLRTLDVIAPLEARLGMPVLSSNLVLAGHMAKLAGLDLRPLG